MRDEIIRFMHGENIIPLAENEIGCLCREEIDEESLHHQIVRQGLPQRSIEENSALYDIQQSRNSKYQYRLAFLERMVDFVDEKSGNTELTIVEGGCATGIDLCFLAKHYADTQHSFRGYDFQDAMRILANARKKRLGLGNIEFYASSHSRPVRREKRQADILFTNSAHILEEESAKITQRNIEGITYRLKSNGYYILAGTPIQDITGVARLAERKKVYHSGTEMIFKQNGIPVYMHFFQKSLNI